VFAWLCPDRSRDLPDWLWPKLGLNKPEATGPDCRKEHERVDLLDSRPWFAPLRRTEEQSNGQGGRCESDPPRSQP
jgi:hypothetical protein